LPTDHLQDPAAPVRPECWLWNR